MRFTRLPVIYIFIIMVLSTMLFYPLNGQTNTSYYLEGVPQAYYMNPATQPQCNIFIGAPILSSFYFDEHNSAFAPNNLFWLDENDSVRHLLSSSDDMNKFLNNSNFKKVNTLSAEVRFNFASFGFRVKEMYFTLDLTSRVDEKFSYPKDLFSFILEGQSAGESFDFSSLNIDLTEYFELGIGVSRKFGEQLTVGIRPKVLFGISTISTKSSEISLNTGLKEWPMTVHTELNVCLLGINMPIDENGVIDLEGDFEFDSTISSASDYRKLATQNLGFGIDIGAHYRPIEKLEISASVLDLGYIKWKNYAHTVNIDGSYTWQGLEWNSEDTIDIFDPFFDTLKAGFEATGSEASFTTTISPKVYVGGRYFVTPAFDAGALLKLDFFRGHVTPDVIILANLRPLSIWSLSLSYNLLDKSYSTFGLGTSFRLGTLNLYIVLDDIPTTYNVINTGSENIVSPNNLYNYNLRFGLNLVFGCNKIKKLSKDRPMYFSDEY